MLLALLQWRNNRELPGANERLLWQVSDKYLSNQTRPINHNKMIYNFTIKTIY